MSVIDKCSHRFIYTRYTDENNEVKIMRVCDYCGMRG